jgi:hypothetical protein
MHEDRTRPYGSQTTGRVFLHQFKHGSGSGRLAIYAVIVGLIGLALGAASLTLFLSYRSAATTQMNQLRQEVAKAQSTLAKAQAGYGSSLSGLASQVSGMDATLNGLAQYGTQCSQALIGPHGPAQYNFPCKQQN